MSMVLSQWSSLNEETKASLRWLLFLAAMAYWRPVHLHHSDVRIQYDPRSNMLTVADLEEGTAQFRMDEPRPQYRWN